jgi:predicted small lipoprotein YifL
MIHARPIRAVVPALLLASLAGCGQSPAGQSPTQQGSVDPVQATQAAPGAPNDPKIDKPIATDAWLGKWVGVEGLALDIAKGPTPGTYKLTVALMDGAESYDGTAMGDHIQFVRGGTTERITKVVGAQTGLKWLAGKTDCLMIKEGEGFCRG